jgi:catechol 2,3-dioxygenase-like lactoylglutathione lyase family enzyme
MIKLMMASALALIAGVASAEPPKPLISMMSVKLGVADFQRATDFYVKYFGMKPGAKYNAAEWGLDWPTPGQGSNIVLVHDASGKLKLTPGTGWIMLKVPDARKIANAMKADRIQGVEPEQDIEQYQTIVVNAHDPDGNLVEMLQVGPAQ